MTATAELSKEELAEFKEAYTLFDQSKKGSISSDELKQVMNLFGSDPRGSEIAEIVASVDDELKGVVDYPDFLKLMHQEVPAEDFKNTVQHVFNQISKGGAIGAKELVEVFANLGETVSAEEAGELLDEAGQTSEGSLSFEQFFKVRSRHIYHVILLLWLHHTLSCSSSRRGSIANT
jgi:calmodulin